MFILAACGFRDGCIRHRHFCAFIFRSLPQTAGRDGKSLIVVGKRESRALNVGDARKCGREIEVRDGSEGWYVAVHKFQGVRIPTDV